MRTRRLFSTKQTIDFGFKEVNWDEKVNMVKNVFNSVASNYDIMNDLTSAGIHRIWKDYFVSSIGPLRHRKIFNDKGQAT